MRDSLSPHGANAVRVPRHEISKGAAARVGLAAAFSPDAQPQRAVVATRHQQSQRL